MSLMMSHSMILAKEGVARWFKTRSRRTCTMESVPSERGISRDSSRDKKSCCVAAGTGGASIPRKLTTRIRLGEEAAHWFPAKERQ